MLYHCITEKVVSLDDVPKSRLCLFHGMCCQKHRRCPDSTATDRRRCKAKQSEEDFGTEATVKDIGNEPHTDQNLRSCSKVAFLAKDNQILTIWFVARKNLFAHTAKVVKRSHRVCVCASPECQSSRVVKRHIVRNMSKHFGCHTLDERRVLICAVSGKRSTSFHRWTQRASECQNERIRNNSTHTCCLLCPAVFRDQPKNTLWSVASRLQDRGCCTRHLICFQSKKRSEHADIDLSLLVFWPAQVQNAILQTLQNNTKQKNHGKAQTSRSTEERRCTKLKECSQSQDCPSICRRLQSVTFLVSLALRCLFSFSPWPSRNVQQFTRNCATHFVANYIILYIKLQHRRFVRLVTSVPVRGILPRLLSFAASAASSVPKTDVVQHVCHLKPKAWESILEIKALWNILLFSGVAQSKVFQNTKSLQTTRVLA